MINIILGTRYIHYKPEKSQNFVTVRINYLLIYYKKKKTKFKL